VDININLPEDDFIQFCVKAITEKKQTLEKSLCDSIEYSFYESVKELDVFVGTSYKHNSYNDKCFSVREYIDNGYIRLYNLELVLELQKGKHSLDPTLILPEYFRIVEPDYVRYDDLSRFKFHRKVPPYKKKALKTKPKYSFNLSNVGVLSNILTEIYEALPDDFKVLLPSNFAPKGDWRQTFYDVKTGKAFFCSCFRKAIEIEKHTFQINAWHPHVKYALDNNSYMDNICHLCTKTEPPSNPFNHSFASIYGCYIYKAYIEMGGANSENYAQIRRDAENAIREKVGYTLIGEGWVSETGLYKRVKASFPGIEVIHHGRPPFLGKQEFDIWIPKYKIAIEYQGIQHYEAIEHWGGEGGLEKRQELDKRKAVLCAEYGIRLFIVRHDEDMDAAVSKIKAAI
jgi:hypothetical protein